jgi:hypothetical protein
MRNSSICYSEEREEDGHYSAAAPGFGTATKGYLPVVLADDAVDDPEAQAGSGVILSRGEGLEHAREKVGRDAGTVVGNDDLETQRLRGVPLVGEADSHAKASAVRHGVDGVAEQVRKNLANIIDAAEELLVGPILALEVYGIGLHASRMEADDRIYEVAETHRPGGVALLMEAQRMTGDLRDPRELEIGELEILAGGGAESFILQGEVEGVGDSGERVVNLVSQASGHASGGGELFGPAQEFFVLLLFVDIGDGADPVRDYATSVASREGAYGERSYPQTEIAGHGSRRLEKRRRKRRAAARAVQFRQVRN